MKNAPWNELLSGLTACSDDEENDMKRHCLNQVSGIIILFFLELGPDVLLCVTSSSPNASSPSHQSLQYWFQLL